MNVKAGYRLTTLGMIPSDWEVRTLESIADKIMVGIASAATHAYRSKGVPMIRNQNIKSGHLDVDDLLHIDPDYEVSFKNKRLRSGDLLTARTGYPGTTCIVPVQFDLAQSFTTLITRPKASAIDSSYLCHFINSEEGQRFFLQGQIGGAQKNVNAGTLRGMFIPVPPVLEQRAIAEALSDVDALIESLDQLIAKKRDIKQAAMQQLLTGQRRLPGFSGEWEERHLGDVVEKAVGGGTPSRTNPAFWGKGIPWVTVKDFATFHPLQAQESITKAGLESSASHLIPAGTLITATRMALGKAVIYEVDVAINQDLKALMLRTNCNASYLKCWFELNASMVDELGSGSTVKGISIADLKMLPFRLAPIDEQLAIVEVLSEMDGELAALEQRRDKTRALKLGMMQELLTGRIRLV